MRSASILCQFGALCIFFDAPSQSRLSQEPDFRSHGSTPFRRPSGRSSESADLPRRISALNQSLKNPYCSGEVRSFGEDGPEREEFGPCGRLRGQQPSAQERAFPGVFRQHGRRRRGLCARQLAEGKDLGSNLLMLFCQWLTMCAPDARGPPGADLSPRRLIARHSSRHRDRIRHRIRR